MAGRWRQNTVTYIPLLARRPQTLREVMQRRVQRNVKRVPTLKQRLTWRNKHERIKTLLPGTQTIYNDNNNNNLPVYNKVQPTCLQMSMVIGRSKGPATHADS